MRVDTWWQQAPCSALSEIAHGTGRLQPAGIYVCRRIYSWRLLMCYTNSAAARATLYCRCMRAAEGEGHSIRFICAHETTGARSSNTTLHPTSPPQAR